MKNTPAKNTSAQSARFLVTETELEYLCAALAAELDANHFGPNPANDPASSLAEWKRGRAGWIKSAMNCTISTLTRKDANETFADCEQSAAMLESILQRQTRKAA